jgi:four helix bundle protein
MGNDQLSMNNGNTNKVTVKGDQLAQRLLDFVVAIIKIVDALPSTAAGRHVGRQSVRSGTSSGSNYEEARGAESRADFVHKMAVVLKELKETRFWLRVIHRTQMLPPERVMPVLDECEQLCAITGKSVFTAKRNKRPK